MQPLTDFLFFLYKQHDYIFSPPPYLTLPKPIIPEEKKSSVNKPTNDDLEKDNSFNQVRTKYGKLFDRSPKEKPKEH